MARPILATAGDGFGDVTLSGGLFLLSIIFLSISFTSMIIFVCNDSRDLRKRRDDCGGSFGCGGDGCGGCGGGGCGGGGD